MPSASVSPSQGDIVTLEFDLSRVNYYFPVCLFWFGFFRHLDTGDDFSCKQYVVVVSCESSARLLPVPWVTGGGQPGGVTGSIMRSSVSALSPRAGRD